MSTLRERKEQNEKGRFYSVKYSFQQIFPHQGLATQSVQAVDLVTPILTEGSLLANDTRPERPTFIKDVSVV